MQIELKFRVAPEELPALRRYPLLRQHASPAARAARCSSTCFDTPDFLLRDHDLALQIMRSGKQWQQTLMRINCHDVQAFACEWTANIPECKPDLLLLTEWLLHEARFKRSRFTGAMLGEIVPMYQLDYRRTMWRPRFDEGREAMVTLDLGEIKSGAAQQTIAELTLTHQSGETDAFYDFALALQNDLKLRPLCRDRWQSGYALRDPASAPPVMAKRLLLRQDADAIEGMQTILHHCLSHICGNAAGLVYGGEVECVHQMRVGLRRLRSALEIFEPLMPCPAAVRTELAWLSAELGDARDWEVLDGVTIPALAASVSGITALQTKVHQEAMYKHRDAASAVDSPRSARLWLLLDQWLTHLRDVNLDAETSKEREFISLRRFAEQHIRRIHKKTRKRCEAMDMALPESRHRVRIASKRLRYATEFFACYFSQQSASRLVAGLADLQDALGASNDTAVADRLLADLAQKYPDLSGVCAYVRGYQAAADDCRLVKLGKRMRRFSALKRLRLRD